MNLSIKSGGCLLKVLLSTKILGSRAIKHFGPMASPFSALRGLVPPYPSTHLLSDQYVDADAAKELSWLVSRIFI